MSKVVLPAIMAPLVAALAAGLATFVLYKMVKRADGEPAAGWFRHAQSVSASLVALAHGTSDGQKTMGVITLVLITAGYQESGTGPQTWVIASAGIAIGLGTYSGGWRIMRTMGKGIVDVQLAAGLRRRDHLGRGDPGLVAHGLRAVHHPGLLPVRSWAPGWARSWPRCGGAPPRKILYGWLLTLPAAALVGGVAAAIALTGTLGLVIVFVALLVGAGDLRHLQAFAGRRRQRQRLRRCDHQPGRQAAGRRLIRRKRGTSHEDRLGITRARRGDHRGRPPLPSWASTRWASSR